MVITLQVRQIVGTNIRTLREKSPKSVEELAAQIGVHRTYWYLLEKGKVNFTIDKLEEVARALGVTVRDLVTERKRKEPAEAVG